MARNATTATGAAQAEGQPIAATTATTDTGAAQTEAQPNSATPEADAAGLCLVGNGTWRYATTDDEATVRGEGYFDHLTVRFGMRAGDVLLVNANGQGFMLGI